MMIAVIADDITGAAEIAGLALRYRLTVQILTEPVKPAADADVLIISTDARSMQKQDALAVTQKAVEFLQLLQPAFIYKKIDSVLRGYILDEIQVQSALTGKHSALIIAPNPSLARTIRQGCYFVDGIPIHQTAFSKDPEFAMKYSHVLQMLRGADHHPVLVRTVEEGIDHHAIIVGEVSNENDLDTWAMLSKEKDLVLAGGGDFFMAVLKAYRIGQAPDNIQYTPMHFTQPFLMVSGTSFTRRVAAIKKYSLAGGKVIYMPASVYASKTVSVEAIEEWSCKITELLKTSGHAVIAIDSDDTVEADAVILRKNMALCVQQVCSQIKLNELFIEGGATAAAIIESMEVSALYPTEELGRGVIKMRAKDPPVYITIKPGSYPLPEDFFETI